MILACQRPRHCPQTSPPTPRRARNTIPSAPARPRPSGAPLTFLFPRNLAVVLAPRHEAWRREHDEPLGSGPTLDPAPSPVRGSAMGHADYVLTHHRNHGRRASHVHTMHVHPLSACQRLTHACDRPARRCIARGWRLQVRARPHSHHGWSWPTRAASRPSQVGLLEGSPQLMASPPSSQSGRASPHVEALMLRAHVWAA